MNELDDVSEELDEAISQLQAAVLERRAAFTLTEIPAVPFIHWAWSDEESRWIGLTFHENQAWLARPDLDPREFASHQAML